MKSIYINPNETRQYILEEGELTTLYNAWGLYIKNEDGNLEQWMPEEDYMVDKDGTEVLYFNQGGQYLFGDTLEFFNEDGSPANLEDTGDDMQVLLSFNGSNNCIERLEHDFDLSDEVVSFMDRLGIDLEEFLNIEEEAVKGNFNTIKLRDFETEDTVLQWAIENYLEVDITELRNLIIEGVIESTVIESTEYQGSDNVREEGRTLLEIHKFEDGQFYAFIGDTVNGDTWGEIDQDLGVVTAQYVSAIDDYDAAVFPNKKPDFAILPDVDEVLIYDSELREWTNDNGGEPDGSCWILPIKEVPNGQYPSATSTIIKFDDSDAYISVFSYLNSTYEYWFGINNTIYILDEA